MMSSEEVVVDLLARIDSGRLSAQIDEPAIQALSEFEWPESPSPTSWEFMRLLEVLVCRLYSSASLGLSPEEAYAQGMVFLDQHFPHGEESGSEAALLEFLHARPGALENLQRALLLGFIAAQRQQAIKALILSGLSRDWPFRCRMARVLIQMFHADLPEEITAANPVRFAASLESFLLACAQSREVTNNSSGQLGMP